MQFKPQVEPEHYSGLAYNSKERFISYWKQIEQVASVSPENVLEVGIGNGFVHRFLKTELKMSVHCVDGDERLLPDTVGDVRQLPFEDGRFDTSCCFETLEHLPFEFFEVSLRELARVARRYVLVSFPDVTPYARVRVEWGFKHTRMARFFDLPNKQPGHPEFNGEHYWEIGWKGYPLERIVEKIQSVGLVLEAHSRLEDDPYHHFFKCTVK